MTRSVHFLAVISLLLTSILARAGDDITEAEQRIFVDHHLSNVQPGAVLRYTFHQTGGPDDSFDDRAILTVKAASKGSPPDARAVNVDFLSGPHKLELPAFDSAEANPAVLYFLEMDVRDMHRALGGQEAYFRKRIRMALAGSARVSAVTIRFNGRDLQAKEISITPFVDDALKDRLKNYAGKRYVFTVSSEVPGAIYSIETAVPATGTGAAQLPARHTVLTLDAG